LLCFEILLENYSQNEDDFELIIEKILTLSLFSTESMLSRESVTLESGFPTTGM
jgi:hypothetical protein